MASQPDVLILGAGAAGLSCASFLKRAGFSATILEARDRVGGRVFTSRPLSPLMLPIELGAEFIHGTPPLVLERLRANALPFFDVTDDHLFRAHGKLKAQNDFFDVMKTVMAKLRSKPKDRTVEAFVQSLRLSKERRDLFTGFVEGFHAADISKMSEAGLKATEETDESDLNGVEAFRLPLGYDRLLHEIQLESSADIQLNHEVTSIAWRKYHVVVQTRNPVTGLTESFTANHALITLPLGVLKSDQIHWDPVPKGFRPAISNLEMGHAMRIIFQFRTRFWEELSKKPVSYLHAGPAHRFPTWWTLAPGRTPFLVAWQGGPKAQEMASWSNEQKVATALETLSYITGIKIQKLQKEFVAMSHHDWTNDPYARGAYSYIPVGGFKKWRRLQLPFEETLFFAGEATVLGPERGTVHGALHSGERAARQMLKIFNRGSSRSNEAKF